MAQGEMYGLLYPNRRYCFEVTTKGNITMKIQKLYIWCCIVTKFTLLVIARF